MPLGPPGIAVPLHAPKTLWALPWWIHTAFGSTKPVAQHSPLALVGQGPQPSGHRAPSQIQLFRLCDLNQAIYFLEPLFPCLRHGGGNGFSSLACSTSALSSQPHLPSSPALSCLFHRPKVPGLLPLVTKADQSVGVAALGSGRAGIGSLCCVALLPSTLVFAFVKWSLTY